MQNEKHSAALCNRLCIIRDNVKDGWTMSTKSSLQNAITQCMLGSRIIALGSSTDSIKKSVRSKARKNLEASHQTRSLSHVRQTHLWKMEVVLFTDVLK